MKAMRVLTDAKLFDLVKDKKLISDNDLQKALAESKKNNRPSDQLLLDLNLITVKNLENLLAQEFGVPYINLHSFKIPIEILNLIPERRIKSNGIIPLFKTGNVLSVATSDPKNIILMDEIRLITGMKINFVVAPESAILSFIEHYYEIDDSEHGITEKLNLELSEKEIKNQPDISGVKNGAEDAPVIKLIKSYIAEAVDKRASDIHIEPQSDGLFIRYRTDGIMNTAHLLDKEVHAPLSSCVKVMSSMDIADKRLPQDGRMELKISDRDIDLRVSSLPGKYGEKLVLRILDKTSFLLGLPELGFSPKDQAEFEEFIKKPYGLLLVVGPTGSGKSTTLYAAINKIKNPIKNIITLEDPIEYELLTGHKRESGITQVQVNPKSGFDFALGLRHILRQDPDVIMVGEIRDMETAEIAMRAALTGHLVFSSLHANDSVETITRLLDMNLLPYLIASALKVVVSQRLVRVLCPQCKEPYNIPKRLLERLGMDLGNKDSFTFYRAKGCQFCDNKGYLGRTGIFELLIMDESIKTLVLEKAPAYKIKEELRGKGWQPLWNKGLALLSKGITSMDELIHVCPPEKINEP